MQCNITKREVDNATPKDKLYILWDNILNGFGCKITPKGNKVYIIQYRVTGNKITKRYTIGKHGSPWAPEEARKIARGLLGEISHNIDPGIAKKALKEAITIKELCDVYEQESLPHKGLATQRNEKGYIKRHIVPLLGNKKAKDIDVDDVKKFMYAVADGKTAIIEEKTEDKAKSIVTGGKGAAARTTSLLSAIMTFAVEKKVRMDNPVRNIPKKDKFKDNKKERYLDKEELKRLGKVLKEEDKAKRINPYAIRAIKLLMLTGARKSEILKLRWENIDFQNKIVILPETKTGKSIRNFGELVWTYLESLERNPSGWIIPGDLLNTHLARLDKQWDIIRKKAKIPDVRVHDLRHTFASFGVSAKASLPILGAVIGHKKGSTTERYAHLFNDPVQTAADNISKEINDLMNGVSNNKTLKNTNNG